MLILSDYREFPQTLKGGVLCIGNFDGVHVGHARMLATGRSEATRRNVPLTIMTFEPHPFAVLRPGITRPPLTTFEQRQELLASFGPDALLVVEPTREFLAITAEEFLERIVRGTLRARLLVEGPTFNFGQAARGTVRMLEAEGPRLGFETLIVPTEQVVLSDMTLVNASSSLIRWLVERGRVMDVAKCLDRLYALRGQVVEGAKRGREIGFPTANLACTQLLPAAGIYAGRAGVDGTSYRAAISIGTNPTFGAGPVTVEAYLLDFSGDLYGRTMTLEFHRWLRETLPFAGVGPLVAQIQKDVAETRRLAAP